jgi:hypothetical protein
VPSWVCDNGGVSEHVDGYPGAPPGWYPDPAGGPGQRWWDGYAWTEATVQSEVPPSPPGWAGPPPGLPGRAANQLVARELSMFPIARIAVAIPALYYLSSLLYQRINRTQLLQDGHQFRLSYEAAEHGRTASAFHASGTVNPIFVLVWLFTIAAVVFACIWQHRAATAARSLGFPAKHSPGWGVGSWFVPIVNLWMPYQAIRDCLPPHDPRRALVVRWWLVLTATWLLTSVAGLVALFSSDAALGIGIPAAVACVGLLATAPQVVTAIRSAHGASLAPHAGV